MFAIYRRFKADVTRIQYPCWLVALVFAVGLSHHDATYAESGHSDTYASLKDFAAKPIASQSASQEADLAYDQASAMWMLLFGESAVVAARKPILTAIDAMQQAGWLAPKTSVVISMLDPRGDFAQFDGERCAAHVNVDDRGSSPIIAALGNMRSSVVFVAAHELAHCRFDMLPISERLPDRQQLIDLGLSNRLAVGILNALRLPNDVDGSAALMTAYDESLADTAAAIALARAETKQQHFGKALENAQSLRFGELFMANRGAIPTAEHQGGFVFEAVARQTASNLNWRLAKRIAMQSVLLSSFYGVAEPMWFKSMVEIDPRQAPQIRRALHEKARSQLAKRRSIEDENLFYSATSVALLTIDSTQYGTTNSDVSQESALLRWKEIAWISADANQPARRTSNLHRHQRSTMQAIITKRE